jgi:hypothetical protein
VQEEHQGGQVTAERDDCDERGRHSRVGSLSETAGARCEAGLPARYNRRRAPR